MIYREKRHFPSFYHELPGDSPDYDSLMSIFDIMLPLGGLQIYFN